MQVEFGGLQTGMTQQSLDGGHRYAGFGQMASKGVAQLVAGDPQTGLPAVFGQAVLDPGDRQTFPEPVEEHRLGLRQWAAHPARSAAPLGVGMRGRRPVEPRPCRAATGGAENGWVQVEVIQRQIADFPYPQTAAQHQQEHGPVTDGVHDGEQAFPGLGPGRLWAAVGPGE